MLIRMLLTLLMSLALLATAAPAGAQLAATPWPKFQADLSNTGKSTASGPSTSAVKIKWTYKAVSWIKSQIAIGPALDGKIYIGDSKFPLCALDPVDGSLLWCSTVGGFVNASSPAVGNEFVDGGQTLQTIYIGERNNIFWAIDSNGDVRWSFKIFLDGDIHTSPAITPEGRVYMACGCTTQGRVHAFNEDGSLRWMVPTINIRNSALAVRLNFSGAGRHRLYLGTTNGSLVAVDDLGDGNGKLAWTLRLATKDYHSSPSIGPDGTIYVGTNKGLFAVEDQGNKGVVRPGWPFTDGLPGEWETAAAISDGMIFASRYYSQKRTVYGISPTAGGPVKLWSKGPATGTTSTSFAQTPSPVVGANGIVYAAIGKWVYALNPANGAEVWKFQLGGDAISLAVGDNVLYVSAKDYTLYALIPQ